MSVAERIAATSIKLDNLRSQRASAILDGGKVDHGTVAAAEAELAALRDAEGEQTKRERVASAHARMTRRGEQIARLKELDRKRTEALTAAEEGARQLAAGLEKALTLNALMTSEMHEITGGVPMPMQPLAFAGRLSSRLSAVMSTIKGQGRRLGNIDWPHSVHKAESSWPVEESKTLAPYLIFKGETP